MQNGVGELNQLSMICELKATTVYTSHICWNDFYSRHVVNEQTLAISVFT